MEETTPPNQQPNLIPVPTQSTSTAKPPLPKKKLSLWWTVLPIVGFSFLIGFIVLNAQQSLGRSFIDTPRWWRLGAFIRLGFSLEFALGIAVFVWALIHFSRQSKTRLHSFYRITIGFTGLVMAAVSIIFAVFAVRAAIALVSSPVLYEGSCTVSYSYYGGSSNHAGSISYYLKVPGKPDGLKISEKTYRTLSDETVYSGSLTQLRDESRPEYPCLYDVHLQYVSAEDTIIELKILN